MTPDRRARLPLFDAITAGVRAGEEPDALAARLEAEYPDLLTRDQLDAAIAYAAKHVKQRQAQRDQDIATVRDLIARLPSVLARLEATR